MNRIVAGFITVIATAVIINMAACKKEIALKISTTPIADITETTATSGGKITSDPGLTITSRGICWSTSPGPGSTALPGSLRAFLYVVFTIRELFTTIHV